MREAARTMARRLEEFLGARHLAVWLSSAWEEEAGRAKVADTDLFITIGGDGTILRAAQLAIAGLTPIVGINLGQLGFMTELSIDEAEEKLTALLSGEGWIDERSLLEAELSPVDGGEEAPRTFYALNDVVVARGAVARVINVEASIDEEVLTTYRADGVIVATATGSTGYALAAGGPVLNPRAREFLLVPILPHLSLAYTMVLSSTAMVKLCVDTTAPATLSIDGHINLELSDKAIVRVRHSARKVRFLRIHPETSFYTSLEQKLKGKH